MTIVRYALLPILLLTLLCNGRPLSAQPAGSGRSFILTQPFFSPSDRGGSPFARLFVSSRTAATVTLTYLASGQTQTFNVAANSSVERLLDITQMMLPESEGIFRKSIQLTGTEPITAALLLDQEFATEGYNAIPDHLLGFEYRAISSDAAREGSVLAIIGINDSTNVTITPNVTTRGGRGANVPFTLLLNRGDVFQLLTNRDVDVDITGSSVVADKPCGFLSGAACAFLPYGFRFSTDFTCNPMTEQIPNSDSWGKEFVVSPLPNEDVGLCRIVAGCDSTSVVIGGKEIAKLNKGGYFEFNPAIVQPVTTSHPALLVQMVTNSAHSFSDLNSPNGDPASMVIAPRNQWGTAFTMVAPNLLPRKDDVGGLGEFVPWKYFIHLTFPESAEDGITIDGVAPAWTFRNANGGFVCGIKEITPGFHSVDSRDPICADGYGRSISDAFAYTLGGVQHPYALTASDDIDLSTCDDQADTVITLHNSGSGPVTILSQSFIGRGNGEILDPVSPFILAPGGDTVVHLRFRHLRDSSVNGYLIGHGGDCDQRLYAVHLRAGAAVITTTPPPGSLFSLGFLSPTVTSHDSTFTITNTGNIPLTVNPPVFSTSEFSIVSPAFPLPIPPHGSVTVTIRYTPVVEGPSDGQVLFTVAACSDTVRLNLTGIWKRGGQIGYTPAAPIVLLCPPKPADTLRLEIADIGDFPYTIFSAAIAGADADEFRLLTALATTRLAPGDKKIVEILYTPGRVGTRNAALHLVTNAILGDTLIPLSVRNDAISLQSTASAIDFGLTSACTPSPSIPFGLLNTGSVRIDHISVALGSSSVGQVTPVSFDSLAAGATANFVVQLSLTAVGTIEDSIVITVPQCNYSLTIPIRAIRAPSSISFAADTLDLGTLSPCEADRQRSIYLRNTSQVLDTITLARGSGSMFSVVGFNGPLYLQPGDSAELRINVMPAGTGTFIDSVAIIDSPCGIQRTLILRASFDSTRPRLSDSAIDFGAVTVGTVARKTVWLFNKTSGTRHYAPITFITGHPGVRVVRPAAAFLLAPGDSVEIEFEYLPASAGDTLSDFARLDESAPCLFRAIALAGRSIGESTTMKLRWEDARGTIGRNISLQLSVEGGSAANALDTFLLKSAVRFNAGLLLPVEIKGAVGLTATITDNRIIGGERRVAFELRGLFPANGTIAELDATAALGVADTTVLAFDGAAVTRIPGGSVVPLLDTIDGMFREDGICRVGSSRFIRIDGTFKLSAGRPNPTSDITTVDFETVESGRTELSLRDMRGNIVRALINEGISPGAYQAVFDVRGLPSGRYWVVLQTPTQRAEGSIVVAR